MQIHLAACLIIEDKMREAGLDPDQEPEAAQTLASPQDFADFFGR